MRLARSAHTSRPWRIHELTPDFRVEDVWRLPTPGGPDDFPVLVALMTKRSRSASANAGGVLMGVRDKIGSLLGWDGPDTGIGTRVPSLRDRLPADLRDSSVGPAYQGLPFSSVYLLHDEWAAEIANQTVHAVLHVGWVSDDASGYHGQLAILVKPNGLLGAAYMAAIRPFRYLVIYPSMLRQIGRAWQSRAWEC